MNYRFALKSLMCGLLALPLTPGIVVANAEEAQTTAEASETIQVHVPREPGQKTELDRKERLDATMERLDAELELTDEQEVEMRVLVEKQMDAIRALLEKHEGKGLRGMRAIKKGRDKLAKQHEEEADAILDDAQLTKYKALREKMRKKFREEARLRMRNRRSPTE